MFPKQPNIIAYCLYLENHWEYFVGNYEYTKGILAERGLWGENYSYTINFNRNIEQVSYSGTREFITTGPPERFIKIYGGKIELIDKDNIEDCLYASNWNGPFKKYFGVDSLDKIRQIVNDKFRFEIWRQLNDV